MTKQYAIILTLLVLIPVLAFLALGKRMIDGERDGVQQQLRTLLTQNLAEIDRSITGYFSQRQRELDQTVSELDSPDEFRHAARSEPMVQQIVLLDSDGAILFPDLAGDLSEREKRFLMRMERVLVDKDILAAAGGSADATSKTAAQLDLYSQSNRSQSPQTIQSPIRRGDALQQQTPSASIAPISGWYTWFWGKGVQLIHWTRRSDGRVVATCLPRARWSSDLIERLPNTRPTNSLRSGPGAKVAFSPSDSLVRLVDSEGRGIYQWGKYESKEDEKPLVSLDLSAPLSSWRLQHFGPPELLESGGRAALFNLVLAGALLAISLFGLAFYLSKELRHRLHEATQRVNFVNQVSHELRTPLTNIRMYADLLSSDLDQMDSTDDAARKHLAVISDESTRLSRLIANVLSFARHRRATLSLRIRPAIVDEIIISVVEQFRPSLDRLAIEVELALDAARSIQGDEDAIGQILGNLIGNVEKYAADGKRLRIESQQVGDDAQSRVTIDVIDCGAGVSVKYRESIFKPFERVSDRIENATGTGIGLAIARELALLHGGDISLIESPQGAHFRLVIASQQSEDNA